MANGLLANAQESHTDLLWAGSGGFDTVHHDDTLTGMGTELYPLGVNSAYLNDTPWLSAAKEIAPTQTLQPGQYIQALSSLTVSGYKNHCVAVKGGGFTFPTVDQLKEWVGTDGFLPTSSFENYTAYNENNITNLYNSAGNLINSSYYLIDNKLDTSASGFFYPMTGNPSGFLTEHQDISHLATKDELLDTSSFLSASISSISSFVSGNDDKYYPLTGNPSGFLTEDNTVVLEYGTSTWAEFKTAYDAHKNIVVYNRDVGAITNQYATFGEIILDDEPFEASFTTIVFGTEHRFTLNSNNVWRSYTQMFQERGDYATTSVVNNISSYLSGEIDNKLDKSESANYYPMTGNPSGFLTEHQSLEEYYKKTETSSKEELSAMFAQFSADDTYTLVGGYNIGISSDDNLKQTTIYYTGTNGDEQVNSVVRQYSAAGTWLTNNDLTNYYTKTDTSSKEELSDAFANAGHAYSGISPIVVNNTTDQISANTWEFSAGEGIKFVDDNAHKKTRIDLSLSAGENISLVYDVETNTYRIDGTSEGKIYNGVAPVIVDNTNSTISISGMNISAGPGINLYEVGNNIVISASGSEGAIYSGISPINVNNDTHEISAKGVSFGVQSPLFFVQDDNEAVIIGCSAGGGGATYTGDDPIYVNNDTNHIGITGESLSAGPNIDIFSSGGYVVISATNASGGTTYTGDAQGALDEVYANSGVWLTAHQSLDDYQTTAAMTGYQTKLASVNNIVYTASLPATPDANTLYLIPEA